MRILIDLDEDIAEIWYNLPVEKKDVDNLKSTVDFLISRAIKEQLLLDNMKRKAIPLNS